MQYTVAQERFIDGHIVVKLFLFIEVGILAYEEVQLQLLNVNGQLGLWLALIIGSLIQIIMYFLQVGLNRKRVNAQKAQN